MAATFITPDQDAIVSEIDIAAPPARVFQALTTAAELKRWFTSTECPAKSGRWIRAPVAATATRPRPAPSW